MLSLTHKLPTEYLNDDIKYTIDLSFDNVLRWYELNEDEELEDYEKIEIAFEMFFHACPINTEFTVKAVDDISNYILESSYGHFEDEEENVIKNDPIKYYSYTQDAEAIYASFFDQYNVDLIEQQGKLHWFKFKALMNGLNDKTYFKRIVSIRTRPTTGLQGQDLIDLQEAQNYYQLDDNKSVEETNQGMNDLFNALKARAKKI